MPDIKRAVTVEEFLSQSGALGVLSVPQEFQVARGELEKALVAKADLGVVQFDVDNRYARLEVRTTKDSADATNTSRLLYATDRLLLQVNTEPQRERATPTYTHGSVTTYAGDLEPRIFTYEAILMDGEEEGADAVRWWYAYENFLRGTQCVESGAEATLTFRDQRRRGMILSCSSVKQSTDQQRTALSFAMLVHRMW